MAKGSFHEDWDELLTRFANRGTPAAIERQLEQARLEVAEADDCRNYRLNQALFERSGSDARASFIRSQRGDSR